MRKLLTVGMVLSTACCLTPTVSGDSVVLEPIKDNTICDDHDNDRSNGAGNYLHAGVADGRFINDYTRRALLAFDIAGAVPAGATITRVVLTLHMSMTTASERTVELRRVLADWGEGDSFAGRGEGEGTLAEPGDATWTHTFFDTGSWATPGGDFSAVVSASQPGAGVAFYTWDSQDMIADVQAWLDAPETDFGWIILGDESEPLRNTAKRSDSRTNPEPANRSSEGTAYPFPLTAPFGGPTVCGFARGTCDRTPVRDPG